MTTQRSGSSQQRIPQSGSARPAAAAPQEELVWMKLLCIRCMGFFLGEAKPTLKYKVGICPTCSLNGPANEEDSRRLEKLDKKILAML
jgi:hypothetical protein